MSAVNETIVREYFESLGFVTSQPCKYSVPGRRKKAEEEIDILLYNPLVLEQKIPGALVWKTEHLSRITRAVVGVRGWHTERFSLAKFKREPEILRFAEEGAVRYARKTLGEGEVAKILCLAELPASRELKKKTLGMLRENGIDGVIVFRTILTHLIGSVDRTKNYENSDLLQIIRIFKSYNLYRNDQMELFEHRRKKSRKS